ncbi:GNAT family N-acetyltransferase [Actinokineospora terrae]|uniref:Protein N-acetyltransferase, RimJ/RimL family n=1 Tax=Actinokineospora terrae TaxID=155974 RepID=A0A1H9XGY3_9PSEU|nr:GNAT family protein [Actinokineospora terrae]SES45319.1 Protein N-acetyltransferase, RimJ/RimL family [Actinokineospora terrae]
MPEPLVLPTITNGEHTLREWSHDDIEVLREAATDPYIPAITTVPQPFDPATAAAYIDRQKDRARAGTGYSFVVVEGSRPIGNIGPWLRDLDLGRASIGYWLVPSARGKGTATRILTTLSDWAFATLHIPRLELYVEPWNTASLRAAQKAGFREEGLLRSWQEIGDNRADMLMFSRIRSDTDQTRNRNG